MSQPQLSNFVWCIYCERAYHLQDTRLVGDETLCAYHDCNGTVEESWDWNQLRENIPYYPPIPVVNTFYSMFPAELSAAS